MEYASLGETPPVIAALVRTVMMETALYSLYFAEE